MPFNYVLCRTMNDVLYKRQASIALLKWNFNNPMHNARLEDEFGCRDWRKSAINPDGSHYGVDVGGMPGKDKNNPNYGKPVFAFGTGLITWASLNGGFGMCVMLDISQDGKYLNNGLEITAIYGHLLRPAVTYGQKVKKGAIIGYMGGSPGDQPNSGSSTASHLHFEVRVEGYDCKNIAIDPMALLNFEVRNGSRWLI